MSGKRSECITRIVKNTINTARLLAWYVKHYGVVKGLRNGLLETLASSPARGTTPLPKASNPVPYLRSYVEHPLGWKLQRVADAFKGWKQFKGVVLAPVGYDLNLKQRPDHILKVLAGEGYLCIMMQLNDSNKGIVENESGVFITNLFEDVIAFFSGVNIILYIHTPLFKYLIDIFPTSYVIYDVLDDKSILSWNEEDLGPQHRHLLRRAEVTLFSTSFLYRQNKDLVHNAVMLANGVWPEDFDVLPRKLGQRLRVGYHGALSELLHIDFLERIAALPDVDLVLVGPVVSFNQRHDRTIKDRYSSLFSHANVEHRGTIPYEQLTEYLDQIDIGLVPFAPSEGTHGVSPLKLFEFMAAGKPILAISTETLDEYSELIDVGSADELLQLIRTRTFKRRTINDYRGLLDRHSWRNLVAPVVAELKTQCFTTPKPAASAKRPGGRVDIINHLFFDRSGGGVLKGGAERYVYDLARLCQSLGYQPRILQNAERAFFRDFRDLPVHGIRVGGDVLDTRAVSNRLLAEAKQADLVIASPLELGAELTGSQPLIGINHGIYWDGVANRFGEVDRSPRMATFDAIQRSRAIVCVDTNFINWVRTEDWDLGRMLHYIPNYVDRKFFYPSEKNFGDPTFRVLFPRRLCTERGLYLMMDALHKLLRTRPEIMLTICGQAVAEAEVAVGTFARRHHSQVQLIERDMDEMGDVYRSHHVVLIPTLASEGTSLSCLEAFASNCAVVGSNVGGLPNLLIDRFNGLLIRPTSRDLYAAVQTLADDRELAQRLAYNATSIADIFGIEEWKDKWTTVINSVAW